MASSIHADNFRNHYGKSFLKPTSVPDPLNPYGAHKVFMESLGRYYSKKGLEVVCIRFGAVGPNKPQDKEGKSVWLSSQDCVSLMDTALKAKSIPNNFLIIYGVSNNKTRVHDYSNPLGWTPKSDSSKV